MLGGPRSCGDGRVLAGALGRFKTACAWVEVGIICSCFCCCCCWRLIQGSSEMPFSVGTVSIVVVVVVVELVAEELGGILVWCWRTLVAWMAILMSFKAAATDSSDWQGSPAPPPSDPNENDVNLDVTSMYYCFFYIVADQLSKETLLLLLSQKKIHSNPSSLIGWNVSCTLLLMVSFDLLFGSLLSKYARFGFPWDLLRTF